LLELLMQRFDELIGENLEDLINQVATLK